MALKKYEDDLWLGINSNDNVWPVFYIPMQTQDSYNKIGSQGFLKCVQKAPN